MFWKQRKRLEELERATKVQRNEIQNLTGQLTTAQRAVEGRDEKYKWNRYSPDNFISKLHDMYDGKLPWGISVGSMIDLRAGFVGGSGINVNMDIPESEKEKAFTEEFLKFNGLKSGGFLSLLRNIDKEAKCLFRLRPISHEWSWIYEEREVKETEIVKAEYLSYKVYNYTVTPDAENKDIAGSAYYKTENDGDVTIEAEELVYRQYRGPANNIDKSVSLWQRCIENVIGLEKAQSDLRTNNHLFAAPKPIVECIDKQQAEETNKLLNDAGSGVNFKARTALILTGKFFYAVPGQTVDLTKEMQQHRYMISFNTGIPVQFLGDPEAVRNKNVSENLMEGVNHAMQADRKITTDLLNELIQKAINLMNGKLTPMNPKAVSVHISEITAADWQRLVNFWFPAHQDGSISRETFLEKIPELNVQQEIERLDAEKEEKQAAAAERQDDFFNKALDSERAEKIEKEKETNDDI